MPLNSSVRTILTNTTLMWKQLPRFGVMITVLLVFDLDWFRKKSLKKVSSQKSGVQGWRERERENERANLKDEIRWQSSKMDGIGGWVIQFVQPWTSKAYSRSVIVVYNVTTLHWLGGIPYTGEPTWANHTIITDFIRILVRNVGISIPFHQYSLSMVPFWNWCQLKACVSLPTSTSHFMVTSHHNMIQKPDLARLLALKITVQAWELLIMPSTVLEPIWVWKGRSWIANEMTRECYSQYSFTDILCWVVPPASQDSSGKWR